MSPDRRMLIGLVVALVILIVVYWAWYRCYILQGTRYGKHCADKGAFCGGTLPDPAAMSEAVALSQMGVRAGEGFCGGAPSPAAVAEFQALEQLGWRPERMAGRPGCSDGSAGARALATEAVAEAHALQKAGALPPSAPYYTARENFSSNVGELDAVSAQRYERSQAAGGEARARQAERRANPAQVDARTARMDSMREVYNGAASGDFGWGSPSGARADTRDVRCNAQCIDGCTGSNCREYCQSRCDSPAESR